MAAGSTAVCDQQAAGGTGRRSRGVQRLGRATDRWPLPARKLVDDYAQFAQACPDSASGIVDACGPKSPDSHRVVWGLTSRPPVPLRAFLRFPVCPPGPSPSPAFLWFPFVRRSPVWSLRPLPGSGSPSVSLRVPFPLSNLHVSAAVRRFRRRWSRAAGTKVTSPAATTPLWIARSARPADGQRLGTMGSRHRIACYERPRAQDIAAPEPPRAAVHVRHATHKATTQRDVRAASLRCTGRRRASAGKAAR
jgi:hypothetical protein